LLTLAAAGLWLWGSRKAPGRHAEWLVAAGCLTFFGALLYANALFYAFTRGGIYTATPWYPQTLAAPLACLLCLGLSRAGTAGRVIGSALVVLSAYLISATYVVKLIPMYSGYGEGSMKATRLFQWYLQGSIRWRGILTDTVPVDAGIILALTSLVVLMSAGICALLCRRFFLHKGWR
jgi:hypothetical protein